jgi:hypothetical protein
MVSHPTCSSSSDSQASWPDPSRIHCVLLGKFQQGKSTFLRVAVPGADCLTGNGTEPTTGESRGFPSSCGTWVVWDTPGTNANEAHNLCWQEALAFADMAVLVKMTDAMLDSAEQDAVMAISNYGVPFILVLNCKSPSVDSTRDDPRKSVKCKVTKQILSWVDNHLPVEPMAIFHANIAWAAAAKDNLGTDEFKDKQIRRSYVDNHPGDPDFEEAYSRSQFDAVYQYLFGSGAEFFKPGGIFNKILASRISRAVRKPVTTNGLGKS